jgi:hypothetical protein
MYFSLLAAVSTAIAQDQFLSFLEHNRIIRRQPPAL